MIRNVRTGTLACFAEPRSSIRPWPALSRLQECFFRKVKGKTGGQMAARCYPADSGRSIPGDDRASGELVVHADLHLAHPRLVGQNGGAVILQCGVVSE